MVCPVKYADLPCALSGVGYTNASMPIGTTQVRLMTRHYQQFPTLADGEYFYVNISDSCDRVCENVKVIGVTENGLQLETGTTTCFGSNSRVSYVLNVQAIADIVQQVGLNVVSPLIWDCDTQTLSIDCQKLKQLIADCGVTNA